MTNSFCALCDLIREDYKAHGSDWTKPGFRSVAIHRFGVWRMSIRTKLLRAPISLFYRTLFRHCRNKYGIELPYSVKLGRRVVIEHQGGIVIHGSCDIGDDCVIRQNCTLGIKSVDDLTAAPVLGSNVSLGAGSVVLGRIHLGDGSVIGANAVVVCNVPPGATAVGIPARIVAR
jgi:serine O-acetyltransferase